MFGIKKEKLGKIFGGRRGIDRAAETVFHKLGNAADVVNVRVSYKNSLNAFWIIGKWFEVSPFCVVAFLIKSAIHQNPGSLLGLKKIVCPSYASRSAVKS